MDLLLPLLLCPLLLMLFSAAVAKQLTAAAVTATAPFGCPFKTGAQLSIAISRNSRTFNDLISKRIDKKMWQVQLGCHEVLRQIKGPK